ERQFQKVVTLIDDNIREEILRPEWIAGETGMSVRSLYRMFAEVINLVTAKNITADLQGRYPWTEEDPLLLTDVSVDVLGGNV
ncbi:intermembrane phospholipid transport protein YdbH family protein, partial [Escherichia coli]|uniref:intermembrane phospholipid transport protein YdbH family protein n=1 Tax=Escherichia coli TaxID=562 RepID=UPI003F5283CB